MEVGLSFKNSLYGGEMWRIACDGDTFKLTLVDADINYFTDPRLTTDGITLGQAQRNSLHERLDEFINAVIDAKSLAATSGQLEEKNT